MLAGTVVSAVMGGMAGMLFALARDQGALQVLFAYQAGGMLAVLAFVTAAQPPLIENH